MDKVTDSPAAALADIVDGSTVAIAGFGVGHSFPSSLVAALRDNGAKDLCIVCNSLGMPGQNDGQMLVENRQVSRLIASFSARPGKQRTETEQQIADGKIQVELVPQGTLVERLRAGGAGIPAFYTATGVGTVVATGKEHRDFDGRTNILERGIQVDYALLRGFRADRAGNIEFRGGSRNFNPSFAKGARIAIVEVDDIVEVGELPPERVGLPGIFVSRVVKSTVSVNMASLSGLGRRAADTHRMYDGKPGLTRSTIAQRAAALLEEGAYVNLGTGIPTLVSNFVAERDVVLHAENGILGYGPLVEVQDADPDWFNAAGGFVSLKPGASFFDSVTSFEMARSGKLSAVILGGYQVDEAGNLANWSTPGMVGGGIGGAMDLIAGGSTLIVVMEHCDSQGRPKLVERCSYPLTGENCVDIVVTDLALLRWVHGEFHLTEIAQGFEVDEILSLMGMRVVVGQDIGIMQDALRTP
jgi:3-oxoacid CoA-transferase